MKALLATIAGVAACAFLACAQALDDVLSAPTSEREGNRQSWSASREDHVDTWVVIVCGRAFEKPAFFVPSGPPPPHTCPCNTCMRGDYFAYNVDAYSGFVVWGR